MMLKAATVSTRNLKHDGLFHANRTEGKHAGQHLGRFPAIQRLKDLHFSWSDNVWVSRRRDLKVSYRKSSWDVVHHFHDLVQDLFRHGGQQKIKTVPLRNDGLLL
jgi:hypothetical protein